MKVLKQINNYKHRLSNIYRYWRLIIKVKNLKVNDKNPYSYPIIIISYNQLSYLRQLIEFLTTAGYFNIVIIDNASTYKPLLSYLNEISNNIQVHRLKHNFGHMVFWKKKEFFKYYGKSYYVVTDPDIIPVKDCPKDFLFYFKELLDRNPGYTKVGFSLSLDDIPDSNPYKKRIQRWERKFWTNKEEEGNYVAEIDTTFALYSPNSENPITNNFFKAIRTKWPYCASHGGWHIDPENMTEEQTYYYSKVNNSASWRINEDGVLQNKEY